MTTFAPLTSASATLSATSRIAFSKLGRSTLDATSNIEAYVSVLNGSGVIERYAGSVGEATTTLTANGGALRAGKATLSATFAKVSINGGVAEILPLKGMAANKMYAAGIAYMGPFTGSATDPLPVPSFALGVANFQPMQGIAYALTGEVGTGDSSFGFASLSADKPYAGSPPGGATVGLRLWSYSYEGEGNFAYSEPQFVFSYGWFDPELVLEVEVGENLEVSDGMTPLRLTEEAYIELVMATGETVSTVIVGASIIDILTASAPFGRRDPMSVWAINAKTNASSKYENFEFNSFAEYKGRYFIANDDGVFEIAGDTDNGTPIVAQVMTGKLDNNSSVKKRMSNAYSGIDSAGVLTLTIFTDDGQRYNYNIASTDGLQTVRTILGRGLYSRYWQVLLTNEDGEMFELESFELMPATATRRL